MSGRTSWLDNCRVTGFIKPDTRGPWTIETFEVPEHSIENMRLAFNGGRQTRPGTYTKLVHENRGIVMSDTDAEIRDLSELFWQVPRGRILVNGLGLGCVVKGLLAIPEVEHIDVVEIDPNIVAMVGPYYRGDRCTIYNTDAFDCKWPPGTTWDFAWHDVWDELSTDNLSEGPRSYARLNRMYGRRATRQGAWGQSLLRRDRDRERRASWW